MTLLKSSSRKSISLLAIKETWNLLSTLLVINYSETSFNVVRQPSTASSQIYIDRERNER